VGEPIVPDNRALSLRELLDAPGDKTYYLSHPLIPKGGRIVIGAPAKHFKSMLALNLAYDLAEGDPLWGIKKPDGSPLWIVKHPLSVLYVENEIGQYRLKERMEKIHGARGGEWAMDNLHIAPKGSGIMLDNDVGMAILAKRIAECQPDVLILDPLRKFHSCDEDSSTEMVKIVYRLDALQKANKDLTTIILHHTGKRSEFRDQTQPEALRGSSVVFDDADTAIMIDRPVKGSDTIIRLNFVLRSAADPRPVRLRFDEETFLFKTEDK
jgi:RecA-family ATPase